MVFILIELHITNEYYLIDPKTILPKEHFDKI